MRERERTFVTVFFYPLSALYHSPIRTLDYSLNSSNAEPASSRYEQKKVLMVRFVRPTTTMVLVVESVVMVLSRRVSAGQALWVSWRVLLVSDVWLCQPLHSAHAPDAESRSIPGYI